MWFIYNNADEINRLFMSIVTILAILFLLIMNLYFWIKGKKKFKIGDDVVVISIQDNPVGKIYDITESKQGFCYWVELEKYNKMEFSDFELKKIKNKIKIWHVI